MARLSGFVLLGLALWVTVSGCGGSSGLRSTQPATPPPTADVCTGVKISGALHDSLTGQPVAQGFAVLETGTQLTPSSLYVFAPVLRATADAQGSFEMCGSGTVSAATPAVIVLLAQDAAGNAYPPMISTITSSTDLGILPMGGCMVTCFLDSQHQTTLPATIQGTITSAQAVTTGSVYATYSAKALDGSKTADGAPIVWSFAIPSLNSTQPATFSTSPAAGCSAAAPNCTSYTFTVPAMAPIQKTATGYQQPLTAPTYLVYALADPGSSCQVRFAAALAQTPDASTMVAPGAVMTAANLAFSGC